MAEKRIPMMDLRRYLSAVVERVYRGRDRFIIIQRQGKDVAALVSLEDLRRLQALEVEEGCQFFGIRKPPPSEQRVELCFRFRVKPRDTTVLEPALVEWWNIAEKSIDPGVPPSGILPAARLTIEEEPNAAGNPGGDFRKRYVVVGIEVLKLDSGDGMVIVEQHDDEMGNSVTLCGTCLTLEGSGIEGGGVYFDLVARETREIC